VALPVRGARAASAASGGEALTLTVCNPLGECATQTVSFRVEASPDDPIIDWIPGQVVGGSAGFRPLDLRCFGWDPDGDAALTWSASDGAALTVSIVDGVLHVAPRDPAWRGTERSCSRSRIRRVAQLRARCPTL